jgi:hypothetical protein
MAADQEYFFIQKKDDDTLPSLTPDENTVDRHYSFEPQPYGAAPFMSSDGACEYARKLGIVPGTGIPDILFAGTDLVVRKHIRDLLIGLDLPGVYMHPAVFVDAYDRRHDDCWFVAIPERLSCWDRQLSEFEDEPWNLVVSHSIASIATLWILRCSTKSPCISDCCLRWGIRWVRGLCVTRILLKSSVVMGNAAPNWLP